MLCVNGKIETLLASLSSLMILCTQFVYFKWFFYKEQGTSIIIIRLFCSCRCYSFIHFCLVFVWCPFATKTEREKKILISLLLLLSAHSSGHLHSKQKKAASAFSYRCIQSIQNTEFRCMLCSSHIFKLNEE